MCEKCRKANEGYDLPKMEIKYHMIRVDHSTAGKDDDGQVKLFRDAAIGLRDAAKEKRDSIDARLEKMKEIVEADPESHYILWHTLENERHAIKRAIPESMEVYGSQELDEREQRVMDFSEGKIKLLATKMEISGSGCNFQYHCHKAIFLGINYQFHDLIQAIHRIFRFLQAEKVEIHIIYAESESSILDALKAKWIQHNTLVEKMSGIIKEYGLSSTNVTEKLARTIGIGRAEYKGKRFVSVLNDCILELSRFEDNSIDLIHTSIPFSNHYEYTSSYNDFGHNRDNDAFFDQMDFLSPELLRVLKPGRVAAIHCKDRIQFGNQTGTGMPTVDPFHASCIFHYLKHGFQFMGQIIVLTDVVRENNQTYRLGWTEQCKDGSKMGIGCPEYILLFRKLPSDTSTAYADEPVTKSKKDYTRARWQIDANAFWRSSGDRLAIREELSRTAVSDLQASYREYSRKTVYDYHEHVTFSEEIDEDGKLPASFAVVAPGSWSEDVWDDVNRMRTLNGEQARKDLQFHICLARGSLVLTSEGYKQIQDVFPGDMVLTHKGRWRPVLAVQNTGRREAVTIRAQGVPGLTLTPDHKLWARIVRGNAWDRWHSRKAAQKVEPRWEEAKNLVGSYINQKLPPVERVHISDEQYWWIIGRWLADGHIDYTGGAVLSCGVHEIDDLTEALEGYNGNPFHIIGTSAQILLRDRGKVLRKTILKCGKGAANKHLPPEAYTLPVEQASALLHGYLSGDGHYLKERQRWMASSVSKELLLGIAILAQRVYGSITSVYAGRRGGPHIIQERIVNTKDDWILCFDVYEDRKAKGTPFILDDGAWKKVRSVEPAGEVETWNLRVEDDESYTAEGCIVKNCPLQFDIVERIINRFSNVGDLVLDPFAGLSTVPYMAVKMGRRGYGIELNYESFKDGLSYLKAADEEAAAPTLFDLIDSEVGEEQKEEKAQQQAKRKAPAAIKRRKAVSPSQG